MISKQLERAIAKAREYDQDLKATDKRVKTICT